MKAKHQPWELTEILRLDIEIVKRAMLKVLDIAVSSRKREGTLGKASSK